MANATAVLQFDGRGASSSAAPSSFAPNAMLTSGRVSELGLGALVVPESSGSGNGSSAVDNGMGPLGSNIQQQATTVPVDFVCPLSRAVMRDPVLVASGLTYERANIEEWFRAGNKTCPLTGEQLEHLQVFPNKSLRSIISAWLAGQNQNQNQNQSQVLPPAHGYQGADVASCSISTIAPASVAHAALQDPPSHAGATPCTRVDQNQTGEASGAKADPAAFSARQLSLQEKTDSEGAAANAPSIVHVQRNRGAGGFFVFHQPEAEEQLLPWSAPPNLVLSVPASNEGPTPGSSTASPVGIPLTSSPSGFDQLLGDAESAVGTQGCPDSSHRGSRVMLGFPSPSTAGENLPSQASSSFSSSFSPFSYGSIVRDEEEKASRGRPATPLLALATPGGPESSRGGGDNVSIGQVVNALQNLGTGVKAVWPVGCKESADGLQRERIADLVAAISSNSAKASERLESVQTIRGLVKNSRENRKAVVATGGVPWLVKLLGSDDEAVVEHAVTALLNISLSLSTHESLVEAGCLLPLSSVLNGGTIDAAKFQIHCSPSQAAKENAAAAFFAVTSSSDENKLAVGLVPGVVTGLVSLLAARSRTSARGRKDAALALFNLSLCEGNRLRIVQADAAAVLCNMLKEYGSGLEEKASAVLVNLAKIPEGKAAIQLADGIPPLVENLECGSERAKEDSVVALLMMAEADGRVMGEVLEEGVMPTLVALTQSGTPRARTKAAKLLALLRSSRSPPRQMSPLNRIKTAAANAVNGVNGGRAAHQRPKTTDGGRRAQDLESRPLLLRSNS